ncbi:hypothetical protein C0J52_26140 [Blattella germanica]|nr:hypothetical protein C0J52_26140 [Blattella germanica]
MQKAAHLLSNIIKYYNLKISDKKTKVIALLGNNDVRSKIVINNKIIEQVTHFQQHVHRMSNTRIPKVMLRYQPRGKRSLGRPMKRWSENPQVRS